jgi:hypothetical protein
MLAHSSFVALTDAIASARSSPGACRGRGGTLVTSSSPPFISRRICPQVLSQQARASAHCLLSDHLRCVLSAFPRLSAPAPICRISFFGPAGIRRRGFDFDLFACPLFFFWGGAFSRRRASGDWPSSDVLHEWCRRCGLRSFGDCAGFDVVLCWDGERAEFFACAQ